MNRKELEAKAEEWLAIKEAEGLRPRSSLARVDSPLATS